EDYMIITIPGEFPTLNEVIKASKSHYMAYANQKKDYTTLTMLNARNATKIDYLADWEFIWYRKDRRNDPDNIQVGTKYILDGLIKANVIDNDGWGQVNSIYHEFKVDKHNPRVDIVIRRAN